jgi:hypothetical protein
MKVKTRKDLEESISKHIDVLLTSGNKRYITASFRELECLITGQCICDLCPEWDVDHGPLYEFSRCLIPTRILQLVKARHYNTKRWSYVLPLYSSLFEKLFDDILPTTGNMASLESEKSVKC